MNKLTKPRIMLLAVILGFSAAVGLSAQRVLAHNGEDHSEDAVQAQQSDRKQEERREESKPASPQDTYSYVAQPGDSYTLLARKATQTYGKQHNVKLSLADIIFVETNLTQAAGSPHLAQGQQIQISEATVKQWVDRAASLSAEDEAGWNYYVQFVDSFNTDSVGQAS
jgi:hypothetical protein